MINDVVSEIDGLDDDVLAFVNGSCAGHHGRRGLTSEAL